MRVLLKMWHGIWGKKTYLVLLVMPDTSIYGISVRNQLTSLSNLYLLINVRYI